MSTPDSPPVEQVTISQMLRLLGKHEQEERAARQWEQITRNDELKAFLISTNRQDLT